MKLLVGGLLILIGIWLGQYSGGIRYTDPVSAVNVLLLGIALALAGVAIVVKG